MKIAIASSGLGHVARGIETWACDSAVALEQLFSCQVAKLTASGESPAGTVVGCHAVTLSGDNPAGQSLTAEQPNNSTGTRDSGAPKQPDNSTTGHSVTLFSGSPLSESVKCHVVVLPCLKRSNPTTQQLSNGFPGFTWRWGLKSQYGWEQLSFWLLLWPKLRRGKFDILHVQDPMVAYWCRLFRKWGLVKTKEILAHGTEETVEFLAKFEYVQQLAPWHLEQTRERRKPGTGNPESERPTTNDQRSTNNHQPTTNNHQPSRKWVAIPNFVDCEVFAPVGGGKVDEASRLVRLTEKQAIRQQLGIPPDAFVIGCVAAVKKHHKRVDYLIREIGLLVSRYSMFVAGENTEGALLALSTTTHDPRPTTNKSAARRPFLLIAGAKTDETDELIALAESLIPGRYKIVTNCGREQMPYLYRAMDVFVLTSLFEMMPIALLEALASGLLCIVNKHPVLEWMIGTESTEQLLSCQVFELSASGESPAGTGVGCQVDKLTDDYRAGQPLAAKQPNYSTTTRDSGATQQPNNSTTGPSGGLAIDMSHEGALAQALVGLTPDWLALHGSQARERAVGMFSAEVVIGQYVEYYRQVMREGSSVEREAPSAEKDGEVAGSGESFGRRGLEI